MSAYVPDFARVIAFTYVDTDKDAYSGLDMLTYQLDRRMMLNQTANPDNKKYHTEISGAATLKTVL